MTFQLDKLNIPEPESETETPEVESEEVDSDSLASPFLSNIPDQDRQVVAKYIKDWDSGVTKKIQGIHQKYERYKSLGDIERVQRSVELAKLLEEDPRLFYNNLVQYLKNIDGEEMDYEDDVEETDETSPVRDLSGNSELEELRAQVEYLSSNFSAKEQNEQNAREMAELDNALKDLHNEHGDFDEDWVLVQISRGVDPVKAISNWNNLVQKSVGSFQKRQPPKLAQSGGGAGSGSQVDPSKLDAGKRKEYVAALLDAANQ